MTRRLLATLAVTALALVGTLWAEEAAKPQDTLPTIKNAASLQQEMLARQYHEFEQALLRLAQRLERSSKPEDKDRAVLLKKAIDLASKEGVNNRFDKLVGTLRNAKIDDLGEFRNAINESDALTKNLLEMLQLLLTDNRAAQLKAEEKRLTELIKEINRIIRDEKGIRNLNDAGKMDPNALAKAQIKVTEATEAVAKALGGNKDAGDPKAGAKGDPKDAGKPGDNKGDPKNDTKDPKSDPKEAKPNEGKPNEGKPNEGKPGEGKPMEGKPNEGKPSEGKPGEGKPMEGKPSEGKPSEGKPGEGKPMDKKPTEGKPNENKPNEAKPSESKGKPDGKGESKPSDSKPSEGKPSEGKPSEGKPSDSKSPPSQGQPSQAKGDPQEGGQKPPPPSQAQQPQTPGKKQIQDAIESQKRAEDELKKAQQDPAGKNIDDAIKKLDEVRKKLEELLRQIREEETERLLAALQQRCEQMLQMQTEVYEGTVKIDKTIADSPDRKATRLDEQKAVALGNREGEIVSICDKAIQLLQAEGTSVAFAHVFIDVRGEMVTVQNRLGRANVDTVTQRHEEEIIATLKDMIAALKKAREDMEKKKSEPKPSQPSQQQQAEQKLIEMLAELKMIRALQVRINSMTDLYSKQYKGEQADAPEIQKELRDLSDRQQKVQEITQKIATGQNN